MAFPRCFVRAPQGHSGTRPSGQHDVKEHLTLLNPECRDVRRFPFNRPLLAITPAFTAAITILQFVLIIIGRNRESNFDYLAKLHAAHSCEDPPGVLLLLLLEAQGIQSGGGSCRCFCDAPCLLSTVSCLLRTLVCGLVCRLDLLIRILSGICHDVAAASVVVVLARVVGVRVGVQPS